MKKIMILGSALMLTAAVAFAYQTKTGDAAKKDQTEKCEKHCCKKDGKDGESCCKDKADKSKKKDKKAA